MVARALIKYLKISPKKLRVVARLLNDKQKVDEALYMLAYTNKKGALILKSAIESAANNAKRLPGKGLTEENLYISRLVVNGGPMLKRFRAMSMGRAGAIRKRTSHVLVELDAIKKAEAGSLKGKKPDRVKKTKARK